MDVFVHLLQTLNQHCLSLVVTATYKETLGQKLQYSKFFLLTWNDVRSCEKEIKKW